jgi:hypothetical protein
MTKVLDNYKEGVLQETIFGMCGKGHTKGTAVLYRLVEGVYEYLDVRTDVVVRTTKLCV